MAGRQQRRVDRLTADQRAILLAHPDRLQQVLVERYRDGRAVVDEVVPAADDRS